MQSYSTPTPGPSSSVFSPPPFPAALSHATPRSSAQLQAPVHRPSPLGQSKPLPNLSLRGVDAVDATSAASPSSTRGGFTRGLGAKLSALDGAGSTITTSGGHGIDDPINEARNLVAILTGKPPKASGQPSTHLPEGDAGLLGELEKAFEQFLDEAENPFQGVKNDPVHLSTLSTKLSSLLNKLRTSPLGGYPIPDAQSGASGSLASANPSRMINSLVSNNPAFQVQPDQQQLLIEQTTQTVTKLFKERQRGREGAEIAASVLGTPI